MYILLNYKIDYVLMSYMKNILFNNDIDFLNKVFFPYLFNIQN